MAEDLGISPEDIRTFLAEAQHLLKSNRVKTRYGDEVSYHWFYIGLQMDSEVLPTIVAVEVRRVNGKPRVFLAEVREPNPEELAEIGAQEESPNTPFPTDEATDSVSRVLHEAKTRPRSNMEKLRRGILAYGGSAIESDYLMGPWRITPARDSASGPLVSEKIVCCDHMVTGVDAFDINRRAAHHLKQLSLLLTVFWTKHFCEIRTGHRWTIDPYHQDGELKLRNELRQLGYSPEPLTETPVPVEDGPTRLMDRLDVRTWATAVSEPWRPPEDASMLFELFERADVHTAQRFLEAVYAYHTAHVIWPTTTTGAIAYLVVAAESLIEEELPRCAQCDQHRGVSKALRDLFFKELPCLLENEAQAKSLLSRAYNIRSRHFHDARFLAGELEEWHPSDILMPDPIAYRATWDKLLGLVNGLLVAYLRRKVTGSVWDRVVSGFPDWREGKHFSMSVHITSGPSQAPADKDAESEKNHTQ